MATRIWLVTGARFDEMEKKIAVLPVGSLERHGDHLPLGTDTIEALFIAERVAEKLNAHLYPPIWYGSSLGLRKYRGTIDVGDEPFYSYVKAVLRGIAEQGYKIILVVNGHGGNTLALRLAAKRVAFEMNTSILVVNWWSDVAQEKRRELFEAPGHAGEDETSAMLYIAPNTVDMSLARDHVFEYMPRVAVYSPQLEERIYQGALLGKATKASGEKGRIWIEAVIDEIVAIVREFAKTLGIDV